MITYDLAQKNLRKLGWTKLNVMKILERVGSTKAEILTRFGMLH